MEEQALRGGDEEGYQSWEVLHSPTLCQGMGPMAWAGLPLSLWGVLGTWQEAVPVSVYRRSWGRTPLPLPPSACRRTAQKTGRRQKQSRSGRLSHATVSLECLLGKRLPRLRPHPHGHCSGLPSPPPSPH